MNGSGEIIFSADPGIDNFGICISVGDYSNKTSMVLEAYTFIPSKISDNFSCSVSQSIRDVKLSLISEEIKRLYDVYRFTSVVCEANYMQASVQAFKSLTECVGCIRHTVDFLNSNIAVQQYEPSVVKHTMGVIGGEKDDMKAALLSCRSIQLPRYVSEIYMDEHTVDAICIGYHHIANPYLLR